VQIWRLPAAPQADCAWHDWPPPWQQTSPPVQLADVLQRAVVPVGQAPVTQVVAPAPPPVGAQHVCPPLQSAGAPQTCVVPDGHAAWQLFGAPAAPVQQT
jgi:hypothetical protein